METDMGDLIVGLMMAVFALIGLILAAGAADDEIYLFGLSLAGFGAAFDLGLVKKHYDKRDAGHV
jgi:hypothetical protein